MDLHAGRTTPRRHIGIGLPKCICVRVSVCVFVLVCLSLRVLKTLFFLIIFFKDYLVINETMIVTLKPTQ